MQVSFCFLETLILWEMSTKKLRKTQRSDNGQMRLVEERRLGCHFFLVPPEVELLNTLALSQRHSYSLTYNLLRSVPPTVSSEWQITYSTMSWSHPSSEWHWANVLPKLVKHFSFGKRLSHQIGETKLKLKWSEKVFYEGLYL